MSWTDSKYCKNFKGDCGNHFVDLNGHTNFDIPSESKLDHYNIPVCFEDTRTKFMELHDRMKEEGLGIYDFPDDEDFNIVLNALVIADNYERGRR